MVMAGFERGSDDSARHAAHGQGVVGIAMSDAPADVNSGSIAVPVVGQGQADAKVEAAEAS